MSDLDRLIAAAGPDYIVPDFVPGISCTQCGVRLKATLAITPPGGDDEAPRD